MALVNPKEGDKIKVTEYIATQRPEFAAIPYFVILSVEYPDHMIKHVRIYITSPWLPGRKNWTRASYFDPYVEP